MKLLDKISGDSVKKWARVLGRSCYITAFNPFGFPAQEVIERCVERNIPVYRTDLRGAVHAVSDGVKWTVTTDAETDSSAKKTQEDRKYHN